MPVCLIERPASRRYRNLGELLCAFQSILAESPVTGKDLARPEQDLGYIPTTLAGTSLRFVLCQVVQATCKSAPTNLSGLLAESPVTGKGLVRPEQDLGYIPTTLAGTSLRCVLCQVVQATCKPQVPTLR